MRPHRTLLATKSRVLLSRLRLRRGGGLANVSDSEYAVPEDNIREYLPRITVVLRRLVARAPVACEKKDGKLRGGI